MSGNQGGGAAIGSVIGAVIGSAVPGVGTGLGAAAGASIGGGAGAAIGGAQDSAKAAQKKLPNSLIQPITKTPVLPTADSNSVNQAKLKSLFDLQNRSGRASTLLTTATTNKFGG